ncbi:MAG: 50S ribosomal protein L30 [Clostridia bacterium]
MSNQLKITLKRSLIGSNKKQRGTVQALGLRKPNQSVIKEVSPQIRGMIKKVSHMLEVEEIN